MLVTLAEEKARQQQQTQPSCQGLALASTSLGPTKQLVDPKAKPWDDVPVWGVVLSFFGRTA
jgi:hypothetical protein